MVAFLGRCEPQCTDEKAYAGLGEDAMDRALKEEIGGYLEKRVAAMGCAPIERFDKAPEGHHPKDLCRQAQTVIVYGIRVPRGMLRSPRYELYALHRSYHSVYPLLDEISLELCNLIESLSDEQAVPVPSFGPLVYEGLEPWGLLSLKHAAVQAGLGSFGRNGLMHHPRHGTLLRLGAVVTSARLAGDPLNERDPCPSDCQACVKACPLGAIKDNGTFDKMACNAKMIKHAIYPVALDRNNVGKYIERVTNTAGYNYWLKCNACLKVCPNNRPKGLKDAGQDRHGDLRAGEA